MSRRSNGTYGQVSIGDLSGERGPVIRPSSGPQKVSYAINSIKTTSGGEKDHRLPSSFGQEEDDARSPRKSLPLEPRYLRRREPAKRLRIRRQDRFTLKGSHECLKCPSSSTNRRNSGFQVPKGSSLAASENPMLREAIAQYQAPASAVHSSCRP